MKYERFFMTGTGKAFYKKKRRN